MRILLAEDDPNISGHVVEKLTREGYQVDVFPSGPDVWEEGETGDYSAIILDLGLPGMDGLDVCKAVRPDFTNPIIMITARDEEIDEVLGLEMGADDYMTKPIRARALLARIRLALRRSIPVQASTAVETPNHEVILSGLTVNSESRSVMLNDELVKLSSNEFDVLWLLAKQAGEVVSRESLVIDLRGFDYDGFDRSIDLRISRLRKKLGDDSTNPFRIKTIWGKGYLLAKDSW